MTGFWKQTKYIKPIPLILPANNYIHTFLMHIVTVCSAFQNLITYYSTGYNIYTCFMKLKDCNKNKLSK